MSKKVIRVLKTTASAIWWGLLIGGIILVVTLLSAHMRGEVPRLFGYSLINIVSGSMEPDIKQGSYILIEKIDPSEVEKDDIICFYSTDPSIYGYPNTHAVVEEPYMENGEYYYVTQGKANLIPDQQPAQGSRLIGRYVTTLGAMTSFLEFISSNMLMVIVLPMGLGMLAMYVGVVITSKKSAKDPATEEQEGSDSAKK